MQYLFKSCASNCFQMQLSYYFSGVHKEQYCLTFLADSPLTVCRCKFSEVELLAFLNAVYIANVVQGAGT